MKSNSKIMTIIAHEYLSKVKTKGFIIGTIIGPILMLIVMVVPSLIGYLSSKEDTKKIAISDKTQLIAPQLLELNNKIYYISNAEQNLLKDSVKNNLLDGYALISEDFLESGKAFIFTTGGGDLSFGGKLTDDLNSIRRKEIINRSGIDTLLLQKVQSSVDLQELTINNDSKGSVEKNQSEVFAILGFAAGFFIYIMMLMYGSLVMRGVIEEKANRIVEVIASSVRPIDIMFGKVFGIGLVGLTQMLFWLVMGGIILMAAGPILQSIAPEAGNMLSSASSVSSVNGMPVVSDGFTIPSISIWVVLAFIFFFLAGYFIYATLFAAVGSAVDQEQDAAQLQTPITITIIIPFLFISAVMTNPNGTLPTILSMVPFFSPMIMLARIVVTDGQLPLWQVLTSMGLCLLTLYGCIWAAAKIYRVGILMYGKKPKLSDLLKWLRAAK